MTILERIHRYHLEVHPRFLELSVEVSASAYNGVGPERWPWVAKIATVAFHRWEPAAYVHDNDFRWFNDGTREGWHESNRRFHRNGKRTIRAEVGWWRFLERDYLMWVNDRLFQAVESDEGWAAWRAAYEVAQAEGPERSAEA